ncbi:MAG TPA: hypothetical protein VF483_05980 [Gemmatimonadaceae bacterium]
MSDRFSRMDRATFLRTAGGLFSVAYLGRLPFAFPGRRSGLQHPEPRVGITSEHVLSAEALGEFNKGKVADAYEAARAHPEVFDGLMCACSCGGKKAQHRSLLSCYETMQPTGCGACQDEAEIAAKGINAGKTLAEIRAAVDKWNA